MTAGQPIYLGHDQPKFPADLGFYDLRIDDVRDAQADMARVHGISGFMYYHYWFTGKPLLETPINRLTAGPNDFPFCLMWANENWTRTWDGGSQQVLAGQNYEGGAAADFIESVIPLLSDPAYMRINGRAILAVYRASQIPHVSDVVTYWRDRAKRDGIELHLLSVVGPAIDGLGLDAESAGFDGTLDFPPHHKRRVNCTPAHLHRRFAGGIFSYGTVVRDSVAHLGGLLQAGENPGVMVGFDNTARYQRNARVWYGSNPYTFHRWFAAAVAAVQSRPEEERLVFVNAWNEWAEGAILEPSDRFGKTYLLAVRDVVLGSLNRS